MLNQQSTPRGALSDAENESCIFLLKRVAALFLTDQIRLLTFRAMQEQKLLVIEVPEPCVLHIDLQDFIANNSPFVRIVRV